MDRSASDNYDLDLYIAELFQTTVDVIDQAPLELVELIRQYIFEKDLIND